MVGISSFMEEKIWLREARGLSRNLVLLPNLIDFSSNDYFGWASSIEVKEYLQLVIAKNADLPIGATGSRLLTGNSKMAQEIETDISLYHQAEAALLMSCGYLANLGLISAIGDKGCYIIRDEYAHASIVDGCRLSFAKNFHFKHNDLQDLQFKLTLCKGQSYVIVESLYSMDGDVAPLADLVYICKQNNAFLIVDEAHALGVHGAGLVQMMGLQADVFARTIAFGKALGCQGGAIVGSRKLIKYLINFCRPFIYSTAMSMLQLCAIQVGYYFLKNDNSMAKVLQQKCALFTRAMGVESNETRLNPIQAIKIVGNKEVDDVALILIKAGFDVRSIKSPTVPKGEERLRICIHTFNSDEDIVALSNLLRPILTNQLCKQKIH